MPGRWYDTLFEIASDQFGFITTTNVRDLDGTPQVLVDMERHGHLDRHSNGLYRFRSFPADARDELMAATLWARSLGVISHDSALDLWELCDVNPAHIHLTIPRSARLRRRQPPHYKVHNRDLQDGDITNLDGIPVVSARRAILGGLERHLDNRLIDQAIDNARRRGLVTAEELRSISGSVK